MKWGVVFYGEYLFTYQHLAELKYVFILYFIIEEKSRD